MTMFFYFVLSMGISVLLSCFVFKELKTEDHEEFGHEEPVSIYMIRFGLSFMTFIILFFLSLSHLGIME